ncbi:hypothetical protein Tco_0331258 [Tanacetum coccineum]
MLYHTCDPKSILLENNPKPPKDKNQRAFVGGSWSDSGEEDDEKVKDETCLVAHASSEVCSESSYFSDENSSIDDIALDNEYDKLCKMSLKIITKNKKLKATRNSLENELRELKDKLSTLEKNKGVDLDCAKCHVLKIENEKLKDESTRLNKFEKSTHCLNEMLSNQKPSGDKLGLGFNSFEASSSGTKEIKFVKSQKKAYSDGGPINMGGPLNDQVAPKINMGPPLAMSGSEKTVSFQKSILGPRPKHIIVNKAKVPVASDNEVDGFVELMNKRKKHFAMLRAEEKRRKPPTKAQKRNLMSTYLKNMGGYKHNQLKSESYEEIQKMFDNEMRRVNTFIPMDSEVVKSKKETEESSKGTGDELESDKTKKVKSSEEKAKGSRKKIIGKKRVGK